ncbi:MAG: GAF domain-containing protein [Proteobacteria bacterium]|nr:GAF domain-containing protein [Pseudomonadota bacterium]
MKRAQFNQKQLNALHVVARDLAKPGEFDPALLRTLKNMSKYLKMKRGMISVFRRDLDEIHNLVAIGMSSLQSDQARYQLGEGITGRVVETGRPIAVPRLDREPLFLDRSGTRRNLNRAELAFICVPIRYGDEVVGALSADFASSSDSDLTIELKLLESVADLIASRVERRRMIEENKRLKDSAGSVDPQGLIIGSSKVMRDVRYLVSQVADSKATVLLTGATGTGKGLVARALHRSSPRKDLPFVHLNCGAIPEQLIESELFGHEKGAFTDATRTRNGRFEAAGNGTIFLDEVNMLPAQAQVKILKVLQDREYERVGSNRTLRTNARIITATNKDLETEVADGKFRADLYYRLNVFPIFIPPLRDRGADIMMLADHFIKVYSDELDRNVDRIDTPAIDMLMAYHWPGNVRELENTIERAVLLSKDGVIKAHLLPPSLQIKAMESRTQKRGKLEQLVASYEMELIVDALKDAEGNQTTAAKLLGTSKRVIQYKVQKYGINYRKFKF